MYGVTLGDHCIVGAGSVVTKSFPSGMVIAGNPAKAICTIDEYAEKYKDYAIDFTNIPLNTGGVFRKPSGTNGSEVKSMRLLILTGNLYPIPGNNANLLAKLIPFLSEYHEVRILSTALHEDGGNLPEYFRGFPIYWISKSSFPGFKRKYLYPVVSKITDPKGNSDVLNALYIRNALSKIKEEYKFDAILTTSEPYPSAVATAMEKGEKILYLMDPPESIRDDVGTKFRNQSLNKVLHSYDTIFTTPFIKEAIISREIESDRDDIISVGFPMVEKHARNPKAGNTSSDVIRLLFCGWMCSELRSPQYFLEIVSRLDERFEITFMGKECELLQEKFPTKTKAEMVLMPNQPYDVALQAMADSDILINIGNSVPVHMPSKTLEYINTGKPIINFYKFKECPTLYYTNRYPLALNVFEDDKNVDAVSDLIMKFCEENLGKNVDRDYIEKEFKDCTPQYIAGKIISALGK